MEVVVRERPRIAYLDHVARLSGGELALLRTLPALLDRIDPLVILGEDGPFRLRLEEQGIRVLVLPLPADLRDTKRSAVLARLARPGDLIRFAKHVGQLRRLLLRERVDLVHTNSLKAALYGGIAGRLARLPVLWHVRDRLTPDYLSGSTAVLVRAAARLIPTAMVANSATTLSTVPHGRRAGVLSAPVVPDSVMIHAEPSAAGRNGFQIGIVGRLAPWKGQDVFLRAFAAAFAGGDARAVVVGSALFGEDDYAATLPPLARRLGIVDQVEFRGFQEDIWRELATLDVLVHASVIPEPFGQVVLEGLAAGVPVIASAEGGPAEIITHEFDGLLVPPREPALLAEAMRRLEADPQLRSTLAENGKHTAGRYHPKATADALWHVYTRMLT